MIFVAMEDKDLIARTSHFRLRSHSFPDLDSDDNSSIPSTTSSENRPVSRRRESTSRAIPPPISNDIPRAAVRPTFQIPDPSPSSPQHIDRYWDNLVTREWAAAGDLGSLHSSAVSHTPLLSDEGFNVTTHCDQPSEDEEEESSPQTLADRYERDHFQREHVLPSFSPTSDEDAEEALERAVIARRMGVPGHHLPGRRRGRRRDSPSRVEVALDGDGKVGGRNILAPHARFFIDREKSTVTVSFDPHV